MAQNQNLNGDNTDEMEIDLLEVLGEVWKHIGAVIIAALLCAIITLAFTIFFIRPKYQAGFTAFINNRSNSQESLDELNSADITAARNLTYTYAAIIKSRPVVEEALQRSNLSDKYGASGVSVSTSVETNTQLVNVTVLMTSPEEAYAVARAIAEVAQVAVAEIVEGSSMKIVSNAVMPTRQYSPNVRRNTMVGFLLGAVLAIIIIVLRLLLDNRVKSEQDLTRHFGISVIGTIPSFEVSQGSGYRYSNYGYGYGGKEKGGDR